MIKKIRNIIAGPGMKDYIELVNNIKADKSYENEDSPVFDSLIMRDPQKAFENALIKGMKDHENWMYMESDGKYDYFKHHDTRKMIRFRNRNSGLMTMRQYSKR